MTQRCRRERRAILGIENLGCVGVGAHPLPAAAIGSGTTKHGGVARSGSAHATQAGSAEEKSSWWSGGTATERLSDFSKTKIGF